MVLCCANTPGLAVGIGGGDIGGVGIGIGGVDMGGIGIGVIGMGIGRWYCTMLQRAWWVRVDTHNIVLAY